jgi:hypothetical protein
MARREPGKWRVRTALGGPEAREVMLPAPCVMVVPAYLQ